MGKTLGIYSVKCKYLKPGDSSAFDLPVLNVPHSLWAQCPVAWLSPSLTPIKQQSLKGARGTVENGLKPPWCLRPADGAKTRLLQDQ